LRDLLNSLKKAYSDKIAVEYSHITNEEEVRWIRDKIEGIAF
jgi:2-oxoglutarate dehydrogenase complex dehydrogenase (E1) component-like enzyme